MKKVWITTLALALAFAAMAAPVYAQSTSNAGIKFVDGANPPEIVDPDPENPTFPVIYDRHLYFGEFEAATATKTYDSTDGSVDIAENLRYTGVEVKNSQLSAVWSVKVSVGPFLAEGKENLENYSLELVPGAGASNVAAEDGFTAPAASGATLRNGDAATTIWQSEAGSNVGEFGQNWSGKPTVPYGSVKYTGTSQAVMTWAVVTEAQA